MNVFAKVQSVGIGVVRIRRALKFGSFSTPETHSGKPEGTEKFPFFSNVANLIYESLVIDDCLGEPSGSKVAEQGRIIIVKTEPISFAS
jgi:hypothetical protein